MSILLAENAEDFSLVEGDKLILTDRSDNAVYAAIPSDRLTVSGSSNTSETYALSIRYIRGVDSDYPDDRWPAVCRQSNTSAVASTPRYMFMYPTGISVSSHDKYCFSIRIRPGVKSGVAEDVLRISVGKYSQVIAAVNQNGAMYINVAATGSNTAKKTDVPTSLFSFYAQKEHRLELVCTKSGTGCIVEIYNNNIKLGTTYSNANSGSTAVMIGASSPSANLTATSTDQPLFYFRDMAVIKLDGVGYSGRLGSSFYIDKHLPTSDITTDWDGDKPHYAAMAANMPVSNPKSISTNNENSREVFGFSGGNTKGVKVAAVGVDMLLRNSGTTTVPVALTFNNAEATVLTLAPSKSANGIVEIPKNPTTAAEWKPNELDSFTSGMTVKET